MISPRTWRLLLLGLMVVSAAVRLVFFFEFRTSANPIAKLLRENDGVIGQADYIGKQLFIICAHRFSTPSGTS